MRNVAVLSLALPLSLALRCVLLSARALLALHPLLTLQRALLGASLAHGYDAADLLAAIDVDHLALSGSEALALLDASLPLLEVDGERAAEERQAAVDAAEGACGLLRRRTEGLEGVSRGALEVARQMAREQREKAKDALAHAEHCLVADECEDEALWSRLKRASVDFQEASSALGLGPVEAPAARLAG